MNKTLIAKTTFHDKRSGQKFSTMLMRLHQKSDRVEQIHVTIFVLVKLAKGPYQVKKFIYRNERECLHPDLEQGTNKKLVVA